MLPFSPLFRKRKDASTLRLFLAMDSNLTTPTSRRRSIIYHSLRLSKTPIENAINKSVVSKYNNRQFNSNMMTPMTSDIGKLITIQPLLLCNSNNTTVGDKQDDKGKKIFIIPTLTAMGNKSIKDKRKFLSMTINACNKQHNQQRHLSNRTENSLSEIKSKINKRNMTDKDIAKHSYNLKPKYKSAMFKNGTKDKDIFSNRIISSRTRHIMKDKMKQKEISKFNIDDNSTHHNCVKLLKSMMNDYLSQIEKNYVINTDRDKDRDNNVNLKYKELKNELRINEACVKKIMSSLKRKQKDNDEFLRFNYNIKKLIIHNK